MADPSLARLQAQCLAMRPPRAPDPKYARHSREDLHRFINDELNVKYNLGVPILPPDLSPSERREQETAATRLYIRLETVLLPVGQETKSLDHLKFTVARPAIDQELREFYNEEKAQHVVHWDKDLTARHYDEWQDGSDSAQTILRCLKRDIGQVHDEWNALSNDDDVSFAEMIQRTHNPWEDIQPSGDVPRDTLRRLRRGYAQTSEWALLKASTTFKLYYKLKPRSVWQLAGWHLCFIKWQVVTETPATAGRMPAVLTSPMHAIIKVDSRAVNQLVETGLVMEGNKNGDEEDDV